MRLLQDDHIRQFLPRTLRQPMPIQVQRESFREHDLERLVGGILKAQGYRVHGTRPGPDGGVDIVAGKGPMGFESPKLVVQVKSGRGEVGVNVLREIQGTMGRYGADMCLIVSWFGFTRDLEREARSSFFTTQLWDSGKLVENLLENYEKLPDEIKADLPLKRVWIPLELE